MPGDLSPHGGRTTPSPLPTRADADYHRQKQMTLGTAEFLRRFCLHILPPRFVKIRHYGLLGNHQREAPSDE